MIIFPRFPFPIPSPTSQLASAPLSLVCLASQKQGFSKSQARHTHPQPRRYHTIPYYTYIHMPFARLLPLIQCMFARTQAVLYSSYAMYFLLCPFETHPLCITVLVDPFFVLSFESPLTCRHPRRCRSQLHLTTHDGLVLALLSALVSPAGPRAIRR